MTIKAKPNSRFGSFFVVSRSKKEYNENSYMPRYFYTAKSLTGESKTGTLEAKDVHQLAKTLRKEGLILVQALSEEERLKKGFKFSLPFQDVSLKEKMFFTRNLQVMISAGLPLTEALETLALQTENKKFKRVLKSIREEIVRGQSFSDSLAKYPNIFSDFFQNLVKVGEETGNLEEVLKILARQMEREHELKSKIRGAMLYPAVIVCAMIGIGILMLIVVVPQLAATFKELEIELPMTTKIVIGLGTFLSQKWYLLIIFLLFLILFFWYFQKIKIGKKILDFFTLKIPIISSIIKNSNSAYTLRSLSSLISAGVPLPRSLEITARILGNFYYKNVLIGAAEKVRKGAKLSETLRPYLNIYPLTVVQMIAVGEETGETSSILEKLADFYEEEVSNMTKNLVSVVEPVLMLIIGGAVGFFAVSMVQPMYSMLGAIK